MIIVLKSDIAAWVFLHFLNCTDGTKSHKTYHVLRDLVPFVQFKNVKTPMQQ